MLRRLSCRLRHVASLSAFAIVVSLLLTSGCATSDTPRVLGAEEISHGIYTSRELWTANNTNTPSGKTKKVDSIVLLSQTESVPPALGTQIGLYFKVKGSPSGEIVDLRKVVDYTSDAAHKNDASWKKRSYSRTIHVTLEEPHFTGVILDEPADFESGTVTVSVYDGARKLLERHFEIVAPTSAAP